MRGAPSYVCLGCVPFLYVVLTYVNPIFSEAYPALQYEGHDHAHDERVLQRPGSRSATGNFRGFVLASQSNLTILPQHTPYALCPTSRGYTDAGHPFRILLASRIAFSPVALRRVRRNVLGLRGHPAVNLVSPRTVPLLRSMASHAPPHPPFQALSDCFLLSCITRLRRPLSPFSTPRCPPRLAAIHTCIIRHSRGGTTGSRAPPEA